MSANAPALVRSFFDPAAFRYVRQITTNSGQALTVVCVVPHADAMRSFYADKPALCVRSACTTPK